MNWYLLQTKPNAHVTACENLRRQGFDVFLPLIIKTTKKNGKFLDIKSPTVSRVSFYGHFNRSHPMEERQRDERYIQGRDARRCLSIRQCSHHRGLQQRCDEHGVFRSLNDIDLGDRAKIERGPFAEFHLYRRPD